jgi:hypothetical protein
VVRELGDVPRPTDDPRTHASGLNADRILLFGGGASIGWGVASHDLALPGTLARAVSARTGRGADVDVLADTDMRPANSERALSEVDLGRYDAIVLTLGLLEVVELTSISRWQAELETLLDYIEFRSSANSHIFLVGVHGLTRLTAYDAFVAPYMGRQRRRFNRATARVAAHRSRVTYVDFDAPSSLSQNRYRTHSQYRESAELLAPAIAAALDHDLNTPEGSSRDRPTAIDEYARHLSLERLNLLDSAPEERLDRLTEFAKRAFHTTSAAITIIDDDRFWLKASAGVSVTEGSRDSAICVTTIGGRGALVVADAAIDARFASMPTVAGTPRTRFYAGFPIEAPDGIAIGTLCVFDPSPREIETFDRALLRDIALMVQKQLWLRSATLS